MEHLMRSHRNMTRAAMFGPSNRCRGSPAISKVSDCARCYARSKERVGVRMCMDSPPKRDGNSENFHPRNNGRFAKIEGINYSRAPLGEEQDEDWRTFRARLVSENSRVVSGQKQFNRREWGHEIDNIEEGCVLVATDELKHHPFLSKSVVLLLKWAINSSTCKGIVLNKALPYDVSSMDLIDPMLRNLGLPAFMGGPAMGGSRFGSNFHVLTREKGVAGFECILPGLYAGNMGVTLQSAIKSEAAMRLYFGEVEMEKRHLRAQIEAFGWWKIAACSRDAIFSTTLSTAHMWCHINHLLTS